MTVKARYLAMLRRGAQFRGKCANSLTGTACTSEPESQGIEKPGKTTAHILMIKHGCCI